jgi:MmpS family membrane protein
MTTTKPTTEPTTDPLPTAVHHKTEHKRAERKVKRPSIFGFARRSWMVLVIAIAVAIAGFCVHRLHGVFGAHDSAAAGGSISDDIKPFNPKHVVYEVFGPPGTIANINYLDIGAQPQRVDNVPLPWTLSVTTTLPSVSVNIVAQGDTDEIGCRIIVNGVVKDEQTKNEVHAQTFCLVKSA